jgi:hypothetical protein
MLSDVCSDTLHSLGEDLVNYADWGYSPKQVLYVVDAMYSLATLGAQLDTPPDFIHPNPELALHSIVLGAILETEDETNKELDVAKLKMLSDLSKIDKRTAHGLNLINKEVVENPTSFILKFNPKLLQQLTEIKKFQDIKS